MKKTMIAAALTLSLLPFGFPAAEAALAFNSGINETMKVSDILQLIAKKSRRERISDCIGVALDNRDAVYDACNAGLPNKNGSRQPCYDIGNLQYIYDVAACRRIQ